MTTDCPEVSVIIPCYNASMTIAETIESALIQAVNTEIIVIDDGSTDNSAEIIRAFGARVSGGFGPNRGASAARNEGTMRARGRFLQYLDADDILAPETLRKRLDALESTGAEVAYTDWQKIVEGRDGNFDHGEVIVPNAGLDAEDIETSCASGAFWCPPAALLYRRTIVDQIGQWRSEFPVIQDARFLFDAAAAGARFVHVSGIGAHYRVLANSLSRRSRERFLGDCLLNAHEIEASWRKSGALSKRRAEALKSMWRHVTIGSFLEGMEEFNIAREGYNRVASRTLSIESLWLLRIAFGPNIARNIALTWIGRRNSFLYRFIERAFRRQPRGLL